MHDYFESLKFEKALLLAFEALASTFDPLNLCILLSVLIIFYTPKINIKKLPT